MSGFAGSSNTSASGGALGTTQTNGTQKTQVVDGSGNVQPSGDTTARSVFTQVSDATTGPVAVKAASTASAFTDKALAVDIRPGGVFQAAAIPADAEVNTGTMSRIDSFLSVFNGTTWDRFRSAVTTVSSTLTGFANTLPWALYHSTPVTRTNGQGGPLETDSTGNLRSADQFAPQYEDGVNGVAAVQTKLLATNTYTPTLTTNRGANATLNIKASAGVVASLSCFNTTASVRYIQLHNTATTPAGAAVPLLSFLVPANAQIIVGQDFFTNSGVYFSTGIAFGISSTMDTYTAATATDHSSSFLTT